MITEAQFWRYVAPIPDDSGCWEWAGSRSDQGYGLIWFSRGPTRTTAVAKAHRVSWELHFGPIPKGLYVCHKCDNKTCVNPGHLFLGTHYENMLDLWQKSGLVAPTIAVGPHGTQTHCKNGHEFRGENLRIVAGRKGHTRRQCLICRAAVSRRHYVKKFRGKRPCALGIPVAGSACRFQPAHQRLAQQATTAS
jgi:hypothetical protein